MCIKWFSIPDSVVQFFSSCGNQVSSHELDMTCWSK